MIRGRAAAVILGHRGLRAQQFPNVPYSTPQNQKSIKKRTWGASGFGEWGGGGVWGFPDLRPRLLENLCDDGSQESSQVGPVCGSCLGYGLGCSPLY